MRTTNYILALSLFAWGLTACTNEETGNGSTTGSETLDISAGLTVTLPAEANTRAGSFQQGETTAFTEKAFSVIVKDNRAGKNNVSLVTSEAKTDKTLTGNTSFDEVGNVAKVNPALAALTPKLFWDDLGGKSSDLNLVGIYPVTANPGIETDFITWSVGANQSAGIDAADLMLAYRPGYTYANKAIAANLNFNHVMAKVTINVIKGDNYGETSFKDPTVVVKNLPASGTINLVPNADKSYTITNASNADITPTTPVLIEGTTSYTTTAIVVPSTVPASTVIAVITINGNNYNVKVKEDTPIIAGANNVLNVTINKSEIAATATITDWGENVISSGTSQLIEVAPALVNENGDSGADKVTVGSQLLVSIKDNSKTHPVTYTATKGSDDKLYWIADKMIYWDDITFGASDNTGVTADAILKLDGSSDPDKLFVATQLTNIPKYADQGTLKFAMKHALSKVVVTIQTTASGSSDAVSLPGITKVELPNYFGYTVNAAAPFITKAANSGRIDITNNHPSGSYVYTAYVYPQTVAVGTGEPKASLIDVTVGTSPTNVYQLTKVSDGTTTLTEMSFEANKVYNITMTLKKSDVAATAKVTIAPWELGSTITGDGEITQ